MFFLRVTFFVLKTAALEDLIFGVNTETNKLVNVAIISAAKIPVNSDDEKISGESSGTSAVFTE